jgi:hypothetical protein
MSKETKTKHTDGPWLISTIEGEGDLMVGGGSDGSKIVADIRVDQYGLRVEEQEANAHLIASAPEMYEALRVALDCIRELALASLRLNVAHCDDPVTRKIREAIAHAEGRELGT